MKLETYYLIVILLKWGVPLEIGENDMNPEYVGKFFQPIWVVYYLGDD